MRDVDEVRRIAREKMGALGRSATGEYGMLARALDEDEEILAAVIGKVDGPGRGFAGRVVVATPRRLLIVGKGFLTRRERFEEIALESVRSVRVIPPARIEFEVDGTVRSCSFVGPPPQLSALAAALRRGPPRFPELDEMLRRKVGRLLGSALETVLVALVEELREDEDVIDMAAVKSGGGLLAMSADRLVLIESKGLGTARPESFALTDLESVEPVNGQLVITRPGVVRRLGPLLPEPAAELLAVRISPRLRPTG